MAAGSAFKDQYLGDVMPSKNTTWNELTSDAALSRLAFSGMWCQHTRRGTTCQARCVQAVYYRTTQNVNTRSTPAKQQQPSSASTPRRTSLDSTGALVRMLCLHRGPPPSRALVVVVVVQCAVHCRSGSRALRRSLAAQEHARDVAGRHRADTQ